MFQEHYNMRKCLVCHPSWPGAKMIVKTLLKHLAALSTENGIHIQQSRRFEDKEGFLFLIRLMDLEPQPSNHASETCKHARIYNHFKRAARCNPDTLDYLCRLVATKISEKYYHLWLLEGQIRNISQRVASHTLHQFPPPQPHGKNQMQEQPVEEYEEVKSPHFERIRSQQKNQKYAAKPRKQMRPLTETTIDQFSKKALSDKGETGLSLNSQKKK